ncbi:MAG: hypothetical protein JWM41_4563 [Gemmatimonadetes bacterium]|nr:hypothetical protein [Gemmatimonadota bacterium]
MRAAWRFTRAAGFAALVCIGCTHDDTTTVRGRGLTVASLSSAAQARVYEAAARVAFDVTDPSLSLLVDPRQLPRAIGLAPEGRLPDAVVSQLESGGVIKGTCEPPLTGTRGNPRCTAPLPGYLMRFSPVFTIRGDSVQVYVYMQGYDVPASGSSKTLRFERAYQVARHGDVWRAVREGRVPKEARGDSK